MESGLIKLIICFAVIAGMSLTTLAALGLNEPRTENVASLIDNALARRVADISDSYLPHMMDAKNGSLGISAERAAAMSTEGLLETCVRYPNMLFAVGNEFMRYFHSGLANSYCGGVNITDRLDVVPVALAYFKEYSIDKMWAKYDKLDVHNPVDTSYLSLILFLQQDDFLSRCTEADKRYLLELCRRNYEYADLGIVGDEGEQITSYKGETWITPYKSITSSVLKEYTMYLAIRLLYELSDSFRVSAFANGEEFKYYFEVGNLNLYGRWYNSDAEGVDFILKYIDFTLNNGINDSVRTIPPPADITPEAQITRSVTRYTPKGRAITLEVINVTQQDITNASNDFERQVTAASGYAGESNVIVESSDVDPHYNCFCYAFYSEPDYQSYWMPLSSALAYMGSEYGGDGSYVRHGSLIYTNSFTSGAYIGEPVWYPNGNSNPHAALVNNTVTGFVRSKWGSGGMVRHLVRACPEVLNMPSYPTQCYKIYTYPLRTQSPETAELERRAAGNLTER